MGRWTSFLSKVDVFGLFGGQFAGKHTTDSDAMVARMIPMLAKRAVKFATTTGGPVGNSAVVGVSGLTHPDPAGRPRRHL